MVKFGVQSKDGVVEMDEDFKPYEFNAVSGAPI